jgi:hypothetical protein
MAFNVVNSKKQGDIGLGSAIAYFTNKGYTVCLPLTDSQPYDLVVDMDGLKKVQVKTTSYKDGRYYQINLSTKGGNRSFNTVKKFDPRAVDYVFALADTGERWLIPASEIKAKALLNLGVTYNAHMIHDT